MSTAATDTASTHISQLTKLLSSAVKALIHDNVLPADFVDHSQLVPCKNPEHGDFASNFALVAAKSAACAPRELAQALLDALPKSNVVAQTNIAGPGFINFKLNQQAKQAVINQVLEQGSDYGRSQRHSGTRIQVEFVSANPTSSLHVGHGRGAAYGMSVANLLKAVGYDVTCEYYVNDAGRQMDILATSAFLRYLQTLGINLRFPTNAYRGDYVKDLAAQIHQTYADKFAVDITALYDNVPKDEQADSDLIGDKEAHIDGLIHNAKTLLGDDNYAVFMQHVLKQILSSIQTDLADFGVEFDVWFSENSLHHHINQVLDQLDGKGLLYNDQGNVWFKSSQLGDEKDRVVRRANGNHTYFASDIAYHKNKFDRGYDRVINIWGADHHGYIARMHAAMQALDIDPKRLEVILVQFVSLWRGEEKVAMSSRSGEFVTLKALQEEVGKDAARYYYVARRPDMPMDFDLKLATSQSRDNPVYYIQYAHARICRLFEKLSQAGLALDAKQGQAHLHLLTHDHETALTKQLSMYPSVLERAAQSREPHALCQHLKDTAALFHAWYNDQRLLPETPTPIEDELMLMQARLRLCLAVKQMIANGLEILDIQAPKSM